MPTYGFLTTDSSLVEVTSKKPKQGYKKAIAKHKRLIRKIKTTNSYKKHPGDWENTIKGKVTKSYSTFRNGIAPVGIYNTVNLGDEVEQ